MATLPTWQVLYDAGRAEVQARAPQLTDWNEGSVLDALVGAAAVLADEVLRVGVDQFAAQFVDAAAGEDLDALAIDRFGLARKAAAASVVTLTWSRSAAGVAYTIPTGTRVRATVDGQSVTFATSSDVELGAATSSVDLPAACQVTGPSGNVAAGLLTEVVDQVAVDPGATVTHLEAAVGGAAAEDDPRFRDRIRRYFTTLRRGTVAALEAGALTVSGVGYATVDESVVAPELGGEVRVYVGDPDGQGNAVLASTVAAALEDWRPAGVRVSVLAASREEVSLELTLTVRSGADTTSLAAAVRAAVAAHVDGLSPAATLYLSQVEHAALGVSPDLLAAEVTLPVTDVVPTLPQNALRLASVGLALTFVEA